MERKDVEIFLLQREKSDLEFKNRQLTKKRRWKKLEALAAPVAPAAVPPHGTWLCLVAVWQASRKRHRKRQKRKARLLFGGRTESDSTGTSTSTSSGDD